MRRVIDEYIFEESGAPWQNKILLIDEDGLEKTVHYGTYFAQHGFDVVYYKDDIDFRIHRYDQLKDPDCRLAVIAGQSSYIPYDVYRRLYEYRVSLRALFPSLNSGAIAENPNTDLDLLTEAYRHNFEDLRDYGATQQFLRMKVYEAGNAKAFVQDLYTEALTRAQHAGNYRDWFEVAEKKARLDTIACEYGFQQDTSELNALFQKYLYQNYGKLYLENDLQTPVIVSRAMEFMHDNSPKFVIIVMDGMSEFDWEILSGSFTGLQIHRTAAMAMIPTITSISRQSLLSGKNPDKLIHPWKQDKEKAEFMDCARDLGYSDVQIEYDRGYDADPGGLVQCEAVIIMDCDEMVHGAQMGRKSMYYGMSELAKSRKLRILTDRLLGKGFDVYISADHGNTECIGRGKLTGAGVETETRSHRMVVLKDFADKQGIQGKYNLMEFPKDYLPQEYDYLVCPAGESLDNKGTIVMSHGGITLDEVVVPFIQIKAEENHG